MNVVFLGTPDFAVIPLKALAEMPEINILAVVCNKDKPIGRKQIITPPPVKTTALELGLPVYQYDSIRSEGVEDLKRLAPDLMVTCAFGQILSQEILDIPKLGVLNIHASLLPKYRGPSPIQYAILKGERQTGVTIMRTDIGVDTGDILLSLSTPIDDNENCGELFERLSVIGGKAIKLALQRVLDGTATFTPQDHALATKTTMLTNKNNTVDFNLTPLEVVNFVRAFNPAPGAKTVYRGEPLKIIKAEAYNADSALACGELLALQDKLLVGCKGGAVSLLTLQKAGGKAMDVKEFLRGNKPQLGEKLG